MTDVAVAVDDPIDPPSDAEVEPALADDGSDPVGLIPVLLSVFGAADREVADTTGGSVVLSGVLFGGVDVGPEAGGGVDSVLPGGDG